MNKTSSWIVYTDGASRGNPGLAGVGAMLLSPGGKVIELKKFLGKQTNNFAEYQAMLLALEELQKQKARHVIVRADSELMIKQMRGEYRVKNENIKPLYQKAIGFLKEFSSVSFEHVRREQNKEADRLANQAIDERP